MPHAGMQWAEGSPELVEALDKMVEEMLKKVGD